MLTTPAGTSEVASTSARVMAGTGWAWLAITMHELPDTMVGAITLTRPSRLDSRGATAATIPVGSGMEKLKYGPATGLALPSTWAILSAQPAYQTQRSMVASTCCSATDVLAPSASMTSAMNWALRPSMTSAIR